MPEKTYTTREVAKMLGVTVQTVQRWVDAGHLRAWRTAGGHRRLAVDSVDAFVRYSKMQLAGDDGPTPPRPAANQPGPVLVRTSPLRVLIVDDDDGDRELAAHQVRALAPDAVLHEADNGFSGLLQLGRQSFDFLLTDISMPHLDGLAMVRTVQADPALAKLRIGAMSSLSRDEISRRGGLPADVLFLPKPLRREAMQGFLDVATAKEPRHGT